jgi:ketosteroid isomerase-like protein
MRDPTDGSPESAVQQELLATAKAWGDAIVSNNADRMAEFVTDDWVIVSAAGISPGSHLLALVASGELTHSSMDVVGSTSVRVLGTTATLTARVVNVAHYRGERFDADEWTTDVFVFIEGRWRCTLTHYTSAATSTASE